jgi:hypothetical protein
MDRAYGSFNAGVCNESDLLIFEGPVRHLTKLAELILHYSSRGTADVVAADFTPPNENIAFSDGLMSIHRRSIGPTLLNQL